jgi:S1-C subfamily serine protease
MAAEKGNAKAQVGLSGCYAEGRGVVKNEIQSYKWALLAFANGLENGKVILDIHEKNLTSEQIEEGQRLAQDWESKHLISEIIDEDNYSGEGLITSNFKKYGSGFFITKDGYILTNHHVVRDCQKILVRTTSGLFIAEIILNDASLDITLLKISGDFDALPIVSSSSARPGTIVATVGFPNIDLQGLNPKHSKGEISSLSGIQDDAKQFQISVPIQPGNSGGSLVDEMGNVIGIVTAQLDQKIAIERSGAIPQNVNYAVKSSYLLSFLETNPQIRSNLIDPKNNKKDYVLMVEDVKKATVLILGY